MTWHRDEAGRTIYIDEKDREYPTIRIDVDAAQTCLILESLKIHAPGDPATAEWEKLFQPWRDHRIVNPVLHIRVVSPGPEPRSLAGTGMMHLRTLRMIPIALRENHHAYLGHLLERFAQLWEHVVTCIALNRADYFRTVRKCINLTTDEGRAFFENGAIYYESHPNL